MGRRMNYLIRAGVVRRTGNRIKCEIALAKFLRMHSLFAYLFRLLPIRSAKLNVDLLQVDRAIVCFFFPFPHPYASD